jgi:hypothetical protein
MARRPNLTAAHLRELARTGAEATLNRLRAEIIAIERTFPELRLPQRRRAVRRSLHKEDEWWKDVRTDRYFEGTSRLNS